METQTPQQQEAPAKPLIYVASSWKNAATLDDVHDEIRGRGMQTWDFRANGFWWHDVAEKYREPDRPMEFIKAPQSKAAFAYDKRGLDACAAGFVVLPAGVSTALEAGYLVGLGKPVVVWGTPREPRLDIMWRFATHCLDSREYKLDEAVTLLVAALWNRGLISAAWAARMEREGVVR